MGQGVENGWHIKSGRQDRGRVMGYGRGGKSPDTLSTEQCSGDDRGWIHNSRIPISRSRGSQSKAAGGRQHLIPALIWGYTSPSTSNCDQGEYVLYHRIGTDKVIMTLDNTILYVLITTLILNNVNICMWLYWYILQLDFIFRFRLLKWNVVAFLTCGVEWIIS